MRYQAHHEITCSRARHRAVMTTAHAWLQENHFSLRDTGSDFVIRARKGSHWGIRDAQRIREMEILIQPEFGLTIISVYHRTIRFGCIASLTKAPLLEEEAESLLETINRLPDPDEDHSR